jgi:hypothetical protein
MECNFPSHTITKKKFRAWATHSFDAAKEVLEEQLQDGASKEAEDYFGSTQRACSTQLEELGSLSDLGLRDCIHNVVHTGIGDRKCPIPYLCCILLACEVGLADTEGSYSNCTQIRFLG